MHELKLYEYFIAIIFNVDNPEIYDKGLDFFLEIYNAKDNQLQDIHRLFQQILLKFYQYKKNGEHLQIKKSLKLINILIDNS